MKTMILLIATGMSYGVEMGLASDTLATVAHAFASNVEKAAASNSSLATASIVELLKKL